MSKDGIRVQFVGDILLHSDYNRIAQEKGATFVFEKVAPLLKNADLRFANLECVLSSQGTSTPGKGCLRGDEKYVGGIAEAGFNILSVANNHAFDFGIEAFRDMAARFEERGVQLVGAGESRAESSRLAKADCKGISFGFLAFSSRDNGGNLYADNLASGVAPLDENRVLDQIKVTSEQVNHLIVSLHWGIEYAPCPTPDQVTLARKMVDAGARVIAGHHPRILQGYEHYKDGVIFYSLGSLCHCDFEIVSEERTYSAKLRQCEKELAIFDVSFSSSGIEEVSILPLALNAYGQPDLCNEAQGAELLQKIKERSEILQNDGLEKYWESLLVKKRILGPLHEWWSRGSLLDKIKGFKLSQLQTLWVLASDYVSARFSKKSSKWLLLNPNNDKKARPYCGDKEDF